MRTSRLYDLAYRGLLLAGGPLLWFRPRLRAKIAAARLQRNGDVPPRQGEATCVLIHAVSVGEVNATRELVTQLLAAQRDLGIYVSVTTDTGFTRANQLFEVETRVTVVRYPLDLLAMVERFLDAVRPSVAVLMELEIWPVFVAECNTRGIPVLLVNGRMTARSFRGFKRIRPLVGPMYRGLGHVAAQEEAYAEQFRALGVSAERTSVTGTMKFDSAHVGERVEGDAALAEELGLRPRALGGDEPVLVCGSTGPGEEEMLLEVWERLSERHEKLRLVLVPRKPERFGEVALLMDGKGEVVRRSHAPASRSDTATEVLARSQRLVVQSGSVAASLRDAGEGGTRPLVLGDTMGELRKFYSLADVVVVGRTLVDLGEKQHGSDMIEPAALGKPVVVGPFTGNFAQPMLRLREGGGIAEVSGSDELFEVLDGWLSDPESTRKVGERAREVVLAQQGATARHAELILKAL